MGTDLYVASAGAMALLRDLDIIANNIANADTTGFKREAPVFEATIEAALRDSDGETVPGGSASLFVDTPEVATDFRPGGISKTGSPLDVAISGPGFFEIETPEGPRYTRAGSFFISPDRFLSTADGSLLIGEGGPIAGGARPLEILSTGAVVDDEGSVLGRLQVVDFDDPSLLMKSGANSFVAPDDVFPSPVAEPTFVSRSIERSNVVPMKELSTLVTVQRAFDIALRSIQTDDQSIEKLIQEFSS